MDFDAIIGLAERVIPVLAGHPRGVRVTVRDDLGVKHPTTVVLLPHEGSLRGRCTTRADGSAHIRLFAPAKPKGARSYLMKSLVHEMAHATDPTRYQRLPQDDDYVNRPAEVRARVAECLLDLRRSLVDPHGKDPMEWADLSSPRWSRWSRLLSQDSIQHAEPYIAAEWLRRVEEDVRPIPPSVVARVRTMAGRVLDAMPRPWTGETWGVRCSLTDDAGVAHPTMVVLHAAPRNLAGSTNTFEDGTAVITLFDDPSAVPDPERLRNALVHEMAHATDPAHYTPGREPKDVVEYARTPLEVRARMFEAACSEGDWQRCPAWRILTAVLTKRQRLQAKEAIKAARASV